VAIPFNAMPRCSCSLDVRGRAGILFALFIVIVYLKSIFLNFSI
jgi:hypothetical protein